MQNARYHPLRCPGSETSIPLSALDDSAAHYKPTLQGQANFIDGDDHASRSDRPQPALGIQEPKPRLDRVDGLNLLVCWAAFIAAVLIVANNYCAWHLGVTYQLVVVGLLLSIMNICLKTISSTLFVELEARFGASPLQNYEAILRNKPFASKASWIWRAVLKLLTLLPIGLSIGYKLFVGGYSSYPVSFLAFFPDYGNEALFYPWEQTYNFIGPHKQRWNPAINAVIVLATLIPPWMAEIEAAEWPQGGPEAFGHNMLVFNQSTTAMLDTPDTSLVQAVMNSFQVDESLSITANVTATVTSYNATVEAHSHEYYSSPNDPDRNSSFWDFYASQGGFQYSEAEDGWYLGMLDDETSSNSDQSWRFLGWGQSPPNSNLSTFAPVARMHTTRRLPCTATWNISSTQSFQLMHGSCDPPFGPNYDADQQLLLNNQLNISLSSSLPYMQDVLGSALSSSNGTFAFTLNLTDADSEFAELATMMLLASDYWSQIASQYRSDGVQHSRIGYATPTTAIHIRPALRRYTGLYLLLAVQPVITLAMFVSRLFMHQVPIGRGFGLVALLAGVDRESLDVVKGADVSGKLKQRVKLRISAGLEKDSVVYVVEEIQEKPKRRKRAKGASQI